MREINELPEDNDLRPSAARLAVSLRDTGYSKELAFADIIDNSIAANATNIVVELLYHFGDLRVVITDNGDGMSKQQLRSAMRYGSPKRENPKSLGKFGMGLKTASTSFCRRLVVISMQDGKEISRAWDLDKIVETDRWVLETPERDDYIDDIEELKERSGTSGTMIIWEKVDRLINGGSEKQIRTQIENVGKELAEELSAVFSKFILSGDIKISMRINDSPEYILEGWDPLCSQLNRDGDGPRAQLLKEKKIIVNNKSDELVFTVKGSIIPSQNELSPKELQEVRYNLDNQGLYIYREGRLIWHDGWPHRMYKKESKVTRLRVELNFTHELDDIFSIDFRKSRVIIPPEVRKELRELIAPWRNELLRKPTSKLESKDKPDRNHGPSDKAIERHLSNTKNADIKIEGDTAFIKNKNQRTHTAIDGVRIYEDKTIRVHEDDSILGDNLWEPALDKEGNTCVRLGKSHPYFSRMYNVCRDNPEAMKALDMLLWSLSHAEYGEYSEKNKITLQGFRNEVSKSLRLLSLELPESDED